MKAYKTYSIITDSKQVILSDMPFRVGEKVEIVVLASELVWKVIEVREADEVNSVGRIPT